MFYKYKSYHILLTHITLEWFPIVLKIKPKVIKRLTGLLSPKYLSDFISNCFPHFTRLWWLLTFWFLKLANLFLLCGLWTRYYLCWEVSESDFHKVLSLLSFRSAQAPARWVIPWLPIFIPIPKWHHLDDIIKIHFLQRSYHMESSWSLVCLEGINEEQPNEKKQRLFIQSLLEQREEWESFITEKVKDFG